LINLKYQDIQVIFEGLHCPEGASPPALMEEQKENEKKKKRQKMKLLPLIAVLLLSTILPSTFIYQASAESAFIAWGALKDSTTPWIEYQTESNICQYAFCCALIVTPNCVNCYEEYTDNATLYAALEYTQEYPLYTSTLWVGDYYYDDTDSEIHWGFYSGAHATPSDHSVDYEIYNRQNDYGYYGNVQLSQLIWTCSCGGVYFDTATPPASAFPQSSDNTMTKYGWVDTAHDKIIGMPFAWTGCNDLEIDGYINSGSGSHVFIGWEGPSLYLMNSAPGLVYYPTNAYFLYQFYGYATGLNDNTIHTVKDALDLAAFWTYYGDPQNFGTSLYHNGFSNPQEEPQGDWYSRLRVIGNAETYLIN
jgi:hypothetical protein